MSVLTSRMVMGEVEKLLKFSWACLGLETRINNFRWKNHFKFYSTIRNPSPLPFLQNDLNRTSLIVHYFTKLNLFFPPPLTIGYIICTVVLSFDIMFSLYAPYLHWLYSFQNVFRRFFEINFTTGLSFQFSQLSQTSFNYRTKYTRVFSKQPLSEGKYST